MIRYSDEPTTPIESPVTDYTVTAYDANGCYSVVFINDIGITMHDDGYFSGVVWAPEEMDELKFRRMPITEASRRTRRNLTDPEEIREIKDAINKRLKIYIDENKLLCRFHTKPPTYLP